MPASVAEAVRREQDPGVDDQEHRGRGRFREQSPEDMLEGKAGDPDRDSADDEEPAESFTGCVDPPVSGGREQTGDDAHPRLAVMQQQGKGGGDMQADNERQKEGLTGRLRPDKVVPPEQLRQQHGVPETGDGHQLGEALDETHHDRLKVAEHPQPLSIRPAGAGMTTPEV